MHDHIKYLDSNAGSFIEKGVFDRTAVDFYRTLFEYYKAWCGEYRLLLSERHFTLAEVPPLIRAGLLQTDEMLRTRLFEGLDDLIHEIGKIYTHMDFSILVEHLKENQEEVDGLISDILSRKRTVYENYDERFNTGVEETIFVIINWMKPFFTMLSEKYSGEIDQEEWYESSCPFCGYYPDIAKIEESKGGKRTLHCALCENEWVFKRIACTICGNTNIETLGFFEEENASPYRIEYCDECEGYIKSVKFGKFDGTDKFDLSVENILTAYLDYSALQKGYHRP